MQTPVAGGCGSASARGRAIAPCTPSSVAARRAAGRRTRVAAVKRARVRRSSARGARRREAGPRRGRRQTRARGAVVRCGARTAGACPFRISAATARGSRVHCDEQRTAGGALGRDARLPAWLAPACRLRRTGAASPVGRRSLPRATSVAPGRHRMLRAARAYQRERCDCGERGRAGSGPWGGWGDGGHGGGRRSHAPEPAGLGWSSRGNPMAMARHQ